ncbi:hypothetical protein CR513_58985, partial [Mucuna pruriens]
MVNYSEGSEAITSWATRLLSSHFELYEKAPGHRVRYCDACGKDVMGFVYHCSRTGYDLHPCCLNLKDTISDEEGCVTLELSHKVPSKCLKCKHRNVVDGVKGWSYRGYLTQETNSIGMSGREYSQLALRSMEIVQRGGTSRRSGTINKYTKLAVLVFKLIFSAVFGNPISAIAALVEALAMYNKPNGNLVVKAHI